MSMDRDDLNDTYDLLSPVRRSNNSYSNTFETSEEETDDFSSTGNFKSSSFSSSPRLPLPKYSSTSRYHGKHPNLPPTKSSTAAKKQIIRHISPSKVRTSHDSTKDLMKIPQEGDRTDLGVWEDWLLRKLQEEREKIKLKNMSERKELEEKEKIEREKEHKKKQAEIKHEQWCEEKVLKLKLQRAIQRREQLLKEELKAQEQDQINAKARAAYERWMEKQKQEDEEKRRKEEEKKMQEMKEKEEKKKRNEECFQEWLKRASERKPSSPRPATGKISEYPAPTFCNPVAWVGPMSDRATRESVRRQHKEMIAAKHEGIRRSRPQTAKRGPQNGRQPKGLISTGPQKGKGVLICRPASAAPLFYSVPVRKNGKFSSEMKRPSKGRS